MGLTIKCKKLSTQISKYQSLKLNLHSIISFIIFWYPTFPYVVSKKNIRTVAAWKIRGGHE